MARHSRYSDEIATEICHRLARGESLAAICRDGDMPGETTVYVWLDAHPEFREKYTRARAWQADTFVDQIIDIANNPEIGEKTRITEDGGVEITRGDMIEHRRLKIDARKWFASKVAPKKYGEKLEHQHAGPDGGAIPMQVTINRTFVHAGERKEKP